MNSRQRVITALRREQPDRVPIVEFLIDPKVAKAAVPDCIDVADCMDQLNMDAVSCGVLFQPVEHYQDETWLDEWGVLYKSGVEVVAHPLKGPIASPEDLRNYNPPDPDSPHRLGQLSKLVDRYKGRRAIIFHQRAAFMWSAYLQGIDNLLCFTDHATSNTYYAIKDHQNTVLAFVDDSGAVAESYEYDAWGDVSAFDASGAEIDDSNIGNRYLFQGREYDFATGLYYFRARWYDPQTGRWLSKDPVGISGGLNQYVFCGNNPVNFVDPLGLSWGGVFIAILVVGIGVGLPPVPVGIAAAIIATIDSVLTLPVAPIGIPKDWDDALNEDWECSY